MLSSKAKGKSRARSPAPSSKAEGKERARSPVPSSKAAGKKRARSPATPRDPPPPSVTIADHDSGAIIHDDDDKRLTKTEAREMPLHELKKRVTVDDLKDCTTKNSAIDKLFPNSRWWLPDTMGLRGLRRKDLTYLRRQYTVFLIERQGEVELISRADITERLQRRWRQGYGSPGNPLNGDAAAVAEVTDEHIEVVLHSPLFFYVHDLAEHDRPSAQPKIGPSAALNYESNTQTVPAPQPKVGSSKRTGLPRPSNVVPTPIQATPPTRATIPLSVYNALSLTPTNVLERFHDGRYTPRVKDPAEVWEWIRRHHGSVISLDGKTRRNSPALTQWLLPTSKWTNAHLLSLSMVPHNDLDLECPLMPDESDEHGFQTMSGYDDSKFPDDVNMFRRLVDEWPTNPDATLPDYGKDELGAFKLSLATRNFLPEYATALEVRRAKNELKGPTPTHSGPGSFGPKPPVALPAADLDVAKKVSDAADNASSQATVAVPEAAPVLPDSTLAADEVSRLFESALATDALRSGKRQRPSQPSEDAQGNQSSGPPKPPRPLSEVIYENIFHSFMALCVAAVTQRYGWWFRYELGRCRWTRNTLCSTAQRPTIIWKMGGMGPWKSKNDGSICIVRQDRDGNWTLMDGMPAIQLEAKNASQQEENVICQLVGECVAKVVAGYPCSEEIKIGDTKLTSCFHDTPADSFTRETCYVFGCHGTQVYIGRLDFEARHLQCMKDGKRLPPLHFYKSRGFDLVDGTQRTEIFRAVCRILCWHISSKGRRASMAMGLYGGYSVDDEGARAAAANLRKAFLDTNDMEKIPSHLFAAPLKK